MSDTLEYIDDYFTGRLSASEKATFEKKLASDDTFAEEVAFYISARRSIRKELISEKKQEFHELFTRLSATNGHTENKVRRIWPYLVAAAACLLAFIAWQMFIPNNSSFRAQPYQLASKYVEQNIKKVSITMGPQDADSLSIGIAAYNKKNYQEAEKIFLALSARDQDAEAIKYLGFVYLVKEDYKGAIEMFDKLTQKKDLYANPGPFYTAVTLMKRSSKGDVARARLILKEVIAQKLPGSKEASSWISKI